MKMQWNATGSVQRIARRPDQRWIGATIRVGSGMTCCSFPKMRAPVETWMIASAKAADANHALAAIVDENTDVTMSVYVELTLARTCIEARRPYWIRSPRVQAPGGSGGGSGRCLRRDVRTREVASGEAGRPVGRGCQA